MSYICKVIILTHLGCLTKFNIFAKLGWPTELN